MTQQAPNLWGMDTGAERPGGEHYVDLIDSLRSLQDVVTCSHPSAESVAEVTSLLDRARGMLETESVAPGHHHAGLRGDVPGRGHPLVVPVHIRSWNDHHVEGHVEFTRFHLGGGIAVHGGATALMFDELLGRLTNSGPPSRTAYLKVDYRNVVPIGRRLHVEATLVRREGRKMFVRGHVSDAGVVLAEGEGLWIELRANASAAERGVLE